MRYTKTKAETLLKVRKYRNLHLIPKQYLWIKEDNIDEMVDICIKEMESYPILKDGNNPISSCPICFDTETTTYKDMGFIYSCQLQVGKISLFARFYQEVFVKFLCELIKKTTKTTYFIGIANMSYDFSFMFSELIDIGNEVGLPFEFVATEPHQLICASIELKGKCGVKFVDICKISGLSLDKTAKFYNLKHQKCEKIDYNKVRNSYTPLTLKELHYNMFDVLAGADFMEYLFETYPKQGKRFPITATSIIRNEMRVIYAEMLTAYKEKTLPQGTVFNPDLHKELFPTSFKKYQELRNHLFAGGYTHGNAFYANMVVENVTCGDESSAYPAVMMQEEFPMTKFEEIRKSEFAKLFGEYNGWRLPQLNMPPHTACYFKITFKNIRQRTMHSYQSNDAMKVYYIKNPVIDNGRIASADYLTVMLTNVDYDSIRKLYDAENFRIEEVQMCKTAPLPRYVLEPLVRAFVRKTQLKMAGLDGTPEYQSLKAILNSGYGCMVQKLILGDMGMYWDEIKEEFVFDETLIGSENNKIYQKRLARELDRLALRYGVDPTDAEVVDNLITYFEPARMEWQEIKMKQLQEVSYYQAKNGAILSPFWGIWVTAYARNRLITMLTKVEEVEPNCVVYYDTDSLYIKDFEKVKHIFDERNKELEAWNLANLPVECVSIGQWDIDPPCNFKHLGAKRYLKQNTDPKAIKKKGEWVSVVAGLPKNDFAKFIKAEKEKNPDVNPFDLFQPNMTIDLVMSSKLTAVYSMQPYGTEVIDKYGNKQYMHHETGVVLKPIPFAIHSLCDYLRIADSMKENYLTRTI